MEFVRKFARPLAPFISMSILFLSFYSTGVQSKVVTTETIVDEATVKQDRKRIRQYYNRTKVKSALKKYGVNVKEAQARIDSLTDAEVRMIANKIDKMPAGAGAEAILVVFLVLIILELLHITNIFSFI